MAVLVLPDKAVSEVALERLYSITGINCVLSKHRSGRPWIVSDGCRDDIQFLRTGKFNIATMGVESYKCDLLGKSALNRLSLSFSDVDLMLLSAIGNSAIAIASSDEEIRAYCPVFLTRNFFWTRFSGLPLLCDEQLPLAALNNYEVNTDVLVARLANLEISNPFSRLTIWRGVEGLGVGEYVSVDKNSRIRRVVWWSPPGQTQTLDELAPVVANGIQTVLEERVKSHQIISTDLSGGLDSTTLSFYAANMKREHHTLFLESSERANNDIHWASRAASEVDSVHHVVSYTSVLEELGSTGEISLGTHPEGPGVTATLSSAVPVLEKLLFETGSTLHLNGHGGDALFGELSTTLWTLARSSWSGRYRWLWSYALLNRASVGEFCKMLLRRGTYRSELARLASGEYAKDSGISNYSRWIQPPLFPLALSMDARRAVARLAERELCEKGRALANERMINEILSYLAVHGAAQRQMNLVSRRVQIDSPYLDLRIAEPAIALNVVDRATRRPTKPLLAAARPPLMDIAYFMRSDKGDYSTDEYVGYEDLVTRIKELFSTESKLEELGLVNGNDVVRLAQSYSPDGVAYTSVANIEFAERWLRSISFSKKTGERR